MPNPNPDNTPAAANSDESDYYLNEQGYIVFTEAYHLKRGYCCENGCKHCPYRTKNEATTKS